MCNTVYDNQCTTVQDEKCEVRYEDKCETKYERKCETKYDSVCRDVQVRLQKKPFHIIHAVLLQDTQCVSVEETKCEKEWSKYFLVFFAFRLEIKMRLMLENSE